MTGDVTPVPSDAPPPGASPSDTARRRRSEPLAPTLDAQSLKALTHPLRQEIIRYLTDHEEATSTTLAKELGESTGQTSYHLRQLARHGVITEIEGRGTGRERWWRMVGFSTTPESVPSLARDPSFQIMAHQSIANRALGLQDLLERISDEPTVWAQATRMSMLSAHLTVEEMAAMSEELTAVAERHIDAARDKRAAGETDGRRRVRAHIDVFPLRREPGDDPGGTAETGTEPQ